MKKALCLLLALMMVLSMAACAQSTTDTKTETSAPAETQPSGETAQTEAAETSSDELTVIRYGAPSTATSAAVWYAYTQGYFQEYGVDLEFIFFNSATSINEAALADEIDMYSLGATKSVTGAVSFGAKMVGYMVPDNSTYRIYARSDSKIAQAGQGALAEYPEIYGDAEAWKGSTLLTTKGQSSHYFFNAILTELGLSESDVVLMDIENNQIPVTFKMGEGDAMCVGNPLWADFADDPNYVFVGSLDMMYPKYDNVCTVMATDKMIERNNDAVQSFVTALVKAQNELSQDADLFAKAMYDWQSEYNVDATEENAAFDATFYTQQNYDYLEAYFTGDAGSTVADVVFSGIVDFMRNTDQLTEDEYAKYQTLGFVAPSYTMNALAELK